MSSPISIAQNRVAVPQTATQYLRRKHAPLSLRLGATLIDYVCIIGVLTIGTIVARFTGESNRLLIQTVTNISNIVALLMFVTNWLILPLFIGRSLGKWATGIHIEGYPTPRKSKGWARPLGLRGTLVRQIIGYPLSIGLVGLGLLMIIFSPSGRALHDILARTIVVTDHLYDTGKDDLE